MNFSFRRYISAMLCSALLGFSFASCSNDDDDENIGGVIPELGTPKYEAESAKYLISGDSDVESIEFTASGNYIICTDVYSINWGQSPRKSAKIKKVSMLKGLVDKSRATTYNGIISGKYTIDSNGVYQLEGFGTITITSEGGSYLIKIRTNEGENLDLNARKGSEIGNSEMTQAICRSWNIDAFRLFIKVGNRTIFDKTSPKAEIKNLLDDLVKTMMKYGDEDDMEWTPEDQEELNLLAEMLKSAEQITFSKSGTYMVSYTNNLLAISTWTWVNENKGLIRYSWDYSDIESDNLGGLATITFNGNKLNVTESMIDEDEDDEDDEDYYPVKFDLTYITSEAK